CPFYGVHRSNQFRIRCRDIFGDVERVPSQYGGEAIALPIRLVCRRVADADTDRAHDPHAAYPFHSEPGGHACYPVDRQHYGFRLFPAILAGGRAFGDGAVATNVFHLAGWNFAELLRAHTISQNALHPAFRAVAMRKSAIAIGRSFAELGDRSRLYCAGVAIYVAGSILRLAQMLYRNRFLILTDVKWASRASEKLRRLSWRLVMWRRH